MLHNKWFSEHSKAWLKFFGEEAYSIHFLPLLNLMVNLVRESFKETKKIAAIERNLVIPFPHIRWNPRHKLSGNKNHNHIHLCKDHGSRTKVVGVTVIGIVVAANKLKLRGRREEGKQTCVEEDVERVISQMYFFYLLFICCKFMIHWA